MEDSVKKLSLKWVKISGGVKWHLCEGKNRETLCGEPVARKTKYDEFVDEVCHECELEESLLKGIRFE